MHISLLLPSSVFRALHQTTGMLNIRLVAQTALGYVRELFVHPQLHIKAWLILAGLTTATALAIAYGVSLLVKKHFPLKAPPLPQ